MVQISSESVARQQTGEIQASHIKNDSSELKSRSSLATLSTQAQEFLEPEEAGWFDTFCVRPYKAIYCAIAAALTWLYNKVCCCYISSEEEIIAIPSAETPETIQKWIGIMEKLKSEFKARIGDEINEPVRVWWKEQLNNLDPKLQRRLNQAFIDLCTSIEPSVASTPNKESKLAEDTKLFVVDLRSQTRNKTLHVQEQIPNFIDKIIADLYRKLRKH